MATWILVGIIVVMAGLAVYKIYKDKKKGSGGCGCGCAGCPHAKKCGTKSAN